MGPAGGVVVPVVPVVVVPVVVLFTPVAPEAVVAPRFFMKYQTAAATRATRTKIHSQFNPRPLSAAGAAGAGVPVFWA